jgi:hypothetical protein
VLDGLSALFGRLSTPKAGGRQGRVHAEREDGVVLFVVGMRINSVLRIHRWLPVFLVAPRMVRELEADPESGLLGSWTFLDPPRGIGFVQYWDSFEALRAYARDSDYLHLDAWREYNREAADGAVGIWHETYRVEAGAHESVYNNVAPRGLGAAAGTALSAATGRAVSAAGRLENREDPPPVEPPGTEE